jgi:acyl-CoA thioester hydrolase
MSTRSGFTFSHRFRVRYAEIDGQKVVFNSRYLEYADVAITEYWRAADMKALPEWRDAEFHVVHADVTYKKPFRYDDVIEAFVRTDRVGTTSLVTAIELTHADTGELHSSIRITSVNVHLDSGKPLPIPDCVRAHIAAFDGQAL